MKAVFFALSSLILILMSCQQEPDDVLDNPQPPGVDSTQLAMYVELDTSLPTGMDTIYVSRNFYDADNRLKTVLYKLRELSDEYSYATEQLYYHGNEGLPYLTVKKSIYENSSSLDSLFVQFANGEMSMDSTLTFDLATGNFYHTRVNILRHTANNNIFYIRKGYNSPGPNAPLSYYAEGTLLTTYSNGNIIAQHDTASGINNIITDRKNWVVTYDNHPNPLLLGGMTHPLMGIEPIQKNNVIELTGWDDPGIIKDYRKFSYVYRADGYPLVKRNADPTSPWTYKAVFYYRH